MSQLGWFEADGVTPLASLPLGLVPPGATPVITELRLVNVGAADATEVSVEALVSAPAPISEYATIAVGEGAFVAAGVLVEVGTLAPAGAVPVFFRFAPPHVAVQGRGLAMTLRATSAEVIEE
jgi:hypothetical protein